VPLVYVSIAWVAGVVLGSTAAPPLPFLITGLCLPALAFVVRRRLRPILLAAACLVLVSAGMLRLHASQPDEGANAIRDYNEGGIVTITGMVTRDPEPGDGTTQLQLAVDEVTAAGETRRAEGAVLLFVPRYPEYAYGDILRVTGQPGTPPRFEDFDYAAYLARRGVQSTMLYPEIEVIDTGQGSPVLDWVYSARRNLASSLAEALHEPQASLTQGMVLGLRGGIPDDVRTDFARSGTSHLLAISGLHLSIIAGLFVGLGTRVFGRRYHAYAWFALSVVWLYAVITGLQPPILRAAIMVSLFLAADMLGRQRSALTSLGFAAAVMVGINPGLPWEPAFQLSFLAMLGLIVVSPRLQALATRTVPAFVADSPLGAVVRPVMDTAAITLGVLIVVWPVIAYHFGIVSLVAPLATVLALPALPAIVTLGGLTAVIGLAAPPVAQVTGWLAWLAASYLEAVVSGLASLPLSSIEIGLDAPLVLTYYAVLGACLWLARSGWRLPGILPRLDAPLSRLPARWVIPPLAASALLAVLAAVSVPDGRLHVSFLDVGQGDAILVQTAAGHDILIDGGPSAGAVTRALGDRMPFWDRRIDLLVLTHPHADHLAGLIEVLRRYRVDRVLLPAGDHDSPLYREWLRLVEGKGVAVTTGRAGQRISAGNGGTVIEVLGPASSSLSGTDESGLVLRVSTGQASFLLTADTGAEAESELARRRAGLASTVLNTTETQSTLFRWMQPHLLKQV
jgi:competence protein ComEC